MSMHCSSPCHALFFTGHIHQHSILQPAPTHCSSHAQKYCRYTQTLIPLFTIHTHIHQHSILHHTPTHCHRAQTSTYCSSPYKHNDCLSYTNNILCHTNALLFTKAQTSSHKLISVFNHSILATMYLCKRYLFHTTPNHESKNERQI